jgi:GT2 family glycosyltransferase
MSVAIVIPVFDRFEFLPALLHQLSNQTVVPDHLVIVDHGIQTLTLHRDWPFQVTILKRSSELWFTAATNEGLSYARSIAPDFIGILNDDVVLGSGHWLERLVEIAKAPNTIAGSTAVDDQGRVLYAGVRLQRAAFRYSYNDRKRLYREIDRSAVDCDVLPTRGILFRTEILDRVGLLDEAGLPHYASDYEWTARAKRDGIQLRMARDVYLITNKASAATLPPRCLRSELADFFYSRHRKGSLPVARSYAAKVFRQPYRAGYLTAHVVKFIAACTLRRLRRPVVSGSKK